MSRFVGVYGWRDRCVDITEAETSLRIKSNDGESEVFPLDECTFVVDAADPDNPTVTFGGFDASGRPRALYETLWGLPRLNDEPSA